jgi:hypothetical protein
LRAQRVDFEIKGGTGRTRYVPGEKFDDGG